MRLVVTQHSVDISFLKNITYILGLNSFLHCVLWFFLNIYGQIQSLEMLGGSP